jgi:HAD superfamily hydrolase (TIGR01509 family)
MLQARYGENFPLAGVNNAFMTRRDEMFEAGLPLKRGTVELLDALQANQCPMAIVTSSSRRTTEAHLTLAGIRERFDTVLTRDDVTHGKPSPDLYLLAASRLSVSPKFCVAVEDSNHGVAAAHAAAALTIMVPDMVPPSDESRTRCVAVVDDLGEVLELLRARGGLRRRSG